MGGMECDADGCERSGAVRLYVPWAETRTMCPAHARALAQQEGVVAEPIAGTDEQWP